MKNLRTICFAVLALAGAPVLARDYHFDGSMSEEVLRSYLSRSMTVMHLLSREETFEENLRMLQHCGVKFAGRALYQWGREDGGESALPVRLALAKERAAKVHAVNPDLILQACIFEIVSEDVEHLAIPAWAFEAFGKPAEARNFHYAAMLDPNGRGLKRWGNGASVPDVSQDETKMWFLFLAASYLDAGCEAIHFGQVELMNMNDPKLDHWADVLRIVRGYAAQHARRHFVVCDAHVPHGGFVRDGHLLFDFHSFPLRIAEIPDRPREADLRVGFSDGLYGRSKGGITPSGWTCKHLPFLVEFDNYGRSRKPGEAHMGGCWVWGWDEITWFSQLPEPARNDWLRYAWGWVREHDAAGYLEMPGARGLSGSPNGARWYAANTKSEKCPQGFAQEETIREIWDKEDSK